MTDNTAFRIGTRGSRLALAQTGDVMAGLAQLQPGLAGPNAMEMVVITTTGDRVQDRLLQEIGGKGLFTKELDDALLNDQIDMAVQSMKDVPILMPEGIDLHVICPREDARDAFISPKADNLSALDEGAKLGTSSLRRKAQVLLARPDLEVVPLRGNVDTRLEKLEAGEVDATLLAVAGLKRLGRDEVITAIIQPEDVLPAVGQGALAATCRSDDKQASAMIASLADPNTAACIIAERALLTQLDGSCTTPIAGHASIDETGLLTLKGLIAHPDGTEQYEANLSGTAAEAENMGVEVAKNLFAQGGPAIFDAIKASQPSIMRPDLDPELDG